MLHTIRYVVDKSDSFVFCKTAFSFFENKGFLEGGQSESLP